MHRESDAMILARVAIGEAPNSYDDQVLVMWNIKLRAALGFKEALPGSRRPENRWGPETSIAVEALCNGGCQYSPVRVTERIYFPCALSSGNPLRKMLCPTDAQLPDFYLTWLAANAVADHHIIDFPEWARGFESFRSPSVTWHGRTHRSGGLPSVQFFNQGNIWQDEYPEDNVFWQEVEAGVTPTAIPSATPTRTPTEPAPSLTPTRAYATVVPTEAPSKEEPMMQSSIVRWIRARLAAVALLITSIFLIAAKALQELAQGSMEAIAFVISVMVGLFGPKPVKWILDKVGLEGQFRVLGVYAISFLVGLLGVFLSKQIFDFEFNFQNVMVVAQFLFVAASYAYHRLKDKNDGSI
jgi:hypothetical protein